MRLFLRLFALALMLAPILAGLGYKFYPSKFTPIPIKWIIAIAFLALLILAISTIEVRSHLSWGEGDDDPAATQNMTNRN